MISKIIKDGNEARVLALNAQGLPHSQIATELGYSYDMIHNFLLKHQEAMEDTRTMHADVSRELAKFESELVKKWVTEADETLNTLRERIESDPTNKELASLASTLARLIEVLGKFTHSFKAETEINVNQIKSEVRNQQFNLMYQTIIDWENQGKVRIIDETFRNTCKQQAKALNIGRSPRNIKQPLLATKEIVEERVENKKDKRIDAIKGQLLQLRKLKDEKAQTEKSDKTEEELASD